MTRSRPSAQNGHVFVCSTSNTPTFTPGTGPTPAQQALTYLSETLDWMHRTKKTGGLGYSITQVKATNAYKAFAVLGGTWNPTLTGGSA